MSFEDSDIKGSRRLCVEDETSGSPVELVVRVTGVLAELDLPPRCRPVCVISLNNYSENLKSRTGM